MDGWTAVLWAIRISSFYVGSVAADCDTVTQPFNLLFIILVGFLVVVAVVFFLDWAKVLYWRALMRQPPRDMPG